ncbi:MAG: CHAT domain-containing protein [Oscillochloridaceae bacterium umkhey_bin13]
MVNICVNLEVLIHCQADGSYTADLRLQMPDSAVVNELATRQAVPLNLVRLRALDHDPAAYRHALTKMVFAEEAIRQAWSQARAYAHGKTVPLRVVLNLGLSAELHALRWERLGDPVHYDPVALSQQVILSRFLASPDLTPIALPQRPQVQALLVVAHPTNLADYQLAPIAVREEIARIKRALDPIPATIIGADPHALQPRATLTAMLEQWQPSPDPAHIGPHILYLVCHGGIFKDEPHLWLEHPDGSSAPTPVQDLVRRVRNLSQRPLLVVLASCQSAGQGYADMVAALGPQLVQAGLPAVLAMQGNVPIQTVEQLMPIFFRELQAHGQVDRALAVARGALHDDPSWWMPVLFSRLRDGWLWREGPMLPTPAPPGPDATQVLPAYLQSLQHELAETAVVPLANAYATTATRAYVPLQVHSPHNPTPEPIFAALNDLHAETHATCLLLRGAAGSGKSHTLRYLALALAQAWPGVAPELQAEFGLALDQPLVPIYVQLQDLPFCLADLRRSEPDREPGLLRLIERHLVRRMARASRSLPPTLLRELSIQSRCLFLLDGLDELDDRVLRQQLQADLRRLLHEQPQHRYVITSRPQSDLNLFAPNLIVRDLLPLQSDQIQAILYNWCHAAYGFAPLPPEHAQQLAQQAADLLITIQHDPDLAPLAPNPLFLTAMARMATSDLGLPRLRVQKYATIIDLLIEWRRNRLHIEDHASLFAAVSHRAALGQLASLALCMLHLGRTDLTLEAFLQGACRELLPEEDADVLDVATCEQLVRSVVRHTGLLSERQGRYRFTFGFRDYFAACALTSGADQNLVERLFDRRTEPIWRTPLLLAVGRQAMRDPRPLKPLFVRLLADGPASILLAAEALIEALDGFVPELDPERRQVLARLHELHADPELIRRLELLDSADSRFW